MGIFNNNGTFKAYESFGQNLLIPIQAGKNYYFKIAATQASWSSGGCSTIEIYGHNQLPSNTNDPVNHISDFSNATFLGNTTNILPVDEFTPYEICFDSPGTFTHLIISVSKGACETYIYVDDLVLLELEDLKLFPDEIGFCDGDEILLGVEIEDANYRWQDGSSAPTFLVQEPGEYWVSIDTVCNLMMADTILIRDDRLLIEEDFLGSDTTICRSNEDYIFEIPNATQGLDYQWSTGESSNSISILESGRYEVTVSKNDCELTDFVDINLQNCTICEVFAPNAFTPNLDGINDIFLTKSNCNLISFQMSIFDRWGNLIWKTDNIEEGWNGKLSGKTTSQGTFAYIINFSVEEFGELVQKMEKGVFVLLP